MSEVLLGEYKNISVPGNLMGKEKIDFVLRTVVEGSSVEVSEDEVLKRAESMVEEYAIRLNQQGLSIESYYKSANTDEKALLEKMSGIARKHLEEKAVLEAIAKKQQIEATQEEYEREIEKLGMRYMLGKAEIMKIMQGKEKQRLMNDIVMKKTLDYVLDHVKETEQ